MTASPQTMDRWCLVGSAEGLLPGKVRAAALMGRDLAIWRTAAGRFHACEDRCVHRGTRLSIGFVRGDQLVCPYHGWHYGEDGLCSFIPAHPDMKPPAKLCLPQFDVSEASGLLWVSLGNPVAPPPGLDRYLYCRSLPVGACAAALADSIAGLRFLPSSLSGTGDPLRPWRYVGDEGAADRARLHWSRPGVEAVAVDYDIDEPAPGLTAITARDDRGGAETRVIALQPEDEARTVLHLLVAAEEAMGEAGGARLETARWVGRLRWFLENANGGEQAYNPWGRPWGREVRCP